MTASPHWPRVGIRIGLIASAAVALFYGAFDLLATRGIFFTVNSLGIALLRGTDAVPTIGTPIPLDWAGIAVYSVVHLVTSLAIGMAVCRLVYEAELRPMLAQVALLFIVAGFAGTIALVGYLSSGIRDVLPWWSIMLANALAVLLAGRVMIRHHPDFLERMTVNPRYPAA